MQIFLKKSHYEGHYQQMFYIIFALLTNYSIIVEPHTAKGRLDVMMETKTDIYVMEMKFNKSAREALDQINDRKYAESFAHKGKPVTKVGLNFSQKDGVSSLDWTPASFG